MSTPLSTGRNGGAARARAADEASSTWSFCDARRAARDASPSRGSPDAPPARRLRGAARSWRGDVLAGVTVGVVALPLALGVRDHDRARRQAGLITAIVAGLVAGDLRWLERAGVGADRRDDRRAGADRRRYGADAVVVVGLLAGRGRVAAASRGSAASSRTSRGRSSRASRSASRSIIFLQQVPAALGVAKPDGENTAAVAARAVPRAIGADGSARRARRRGARRGGHGPGAARCTGRCPRRCSPWRRDRSSPRRVGLRVAAHRRPARLASRADAPGHRPVGDVRELLPPAFAVAALAALESLLSAKVADGMADGRAHDPDRELFGQGLANLVVAAVRRHAGDRRDRPDRGQRPRRRPHPASRPSPTRSSWSASSTSAPAASSAIPLAALAGVLMVTAVRMVESATFAPSCARRRSDAAGAGDHRPARSPST